MRLRTVLISTQHAPGVERDAQIRPDLIEQVIRPSCPAQFADDDYEVYVNPTGTFELGGPHADTGLTGRKIIVDTYGGMARHGGGAFSRQGPVEGRPLGRLRRPLGGQARRRRRARASRCEVQVAYAIGVAQPVSLMVETFGTEHRRRRGRSRRPCSDVFDLRPRRHHPRPRPAPPDLPQDGGLRPLRPPELPEFTWEQLGKLDDLKSRASGLVTSAQR